MIIEFKIAITAAALFALAWIFTPWDYKDTWFEICAVVGVSSMITVPVALLVALWRHA